MSTEELVFEIADGIATIRLNRPERLNAFTHPMLDAWAAALETCARDDAVRAVVLRINCLCHSSCGGSTASPMRKRSQIVSQAASRRLRRRESGSRMGTASATQLPSNRTKPSAVNWTAASPTWSRYQLCT